MNKDFLTLEEAAQTLKKSTQTIRRMIKKGELQAQKIRTPQGFHYVVSREEVLGSAEAPISEPEENPIIEREDEELMFSNSPIQNTEEPQLEKENDVLINQTQILTNQNPVEPIPEPVQVPLDKMEPKTVFYFPPLPTPPAVETKELLKLIERQHREHMGLLRIMEQLQQELFAERHKPQKGRWERFLAWLQGN